MKDGPYVVAADDDGIRLDRWIKRHLPELSYSVLARWARTGQVRLDGKRVSPGDRLVVGQVIRLPPLDLASPEDKSTHSSPEPLSALDIEETQAMVLYKDDSAIVVNKPPGLATQGGSGTDRHLDMLLDALCFEREHRPRLVHRLDKDTSGVILLARTAAAAAFFAAQLKGRLATKVYWALTMGVPSPAAGDIVAPLAKQPGRGGEKMHVDVQDGLSARTAYRVVEHVGNRAAWVEFQPLTGRTHQIRAHAASIGHPIVGDGKYGGKEAFLTGGVSRKMHLHARQLILPHPQGGFLNVSAPLPSHMSETWGLLGFDVALAPGYDPQQLENERLERVERAEKSRAYHEREQALRRARPPVRRGAKRGRRP